MSQTLDTCRQKCQKLRHPRIASSPLKAERPVFSQLARSRSERGFGSGGAPWLGVEATRYLKMVYFHRGDVMSTSTPLAVQSLPLCGRSRSGWMCLSVIFCKSSPVLPHRARAGCAARTCPCSALAGLPLHPELLHESMPPPTSRSSKKGSSAHGSNQEEKTMTMLAALGIAIAVVVIAAVVAHTRRSSKNRQPIELGVGRKLRP